MQFVLTDAGRSKSKRSKQKNDCTVRALSLALNILYDDAYDIISKAGRKSSKKFSQEKIWKYLGKLSEQDFFVIYRDIDKPKNIYTLNFPSEAGKTRMNTLKFIQQYPKGIYILKQAKHVCTVIDGILYDTFESWDRCVYKAYKISNK